MDVSDVASQTLGWTRAVEAHGHVRTSRGANLRDARLDGIGRRGRPRSLAPAARHHLQDRRAALRLAEGDVQSGAGPGPRGARAAPRGARGLARGAERSGVPAVSGGRRRSQPVAVPARHPRSLARDGQALLRRSVRPPRTVRRRGGPVPGHDDRRVEWLDRHAVQLDTRPTGARGRPSQHRFLRPIRIRAPS
jgi:hypothetical protein